MENSAEHHEVPNRSIGKLMFLRVVVVTFLLGIAVSIQIKGTTSLPPESVNNIFLIIIITYFLSIVYVFCQKRFKAIGSNLYVQILCDIVLITALVYVTGGVESVYSVLYQLVIIYAALFLSRRGGMMAASASSILYGLLLNLEYYGVLTALGATAAYAYSAGFVLSRIFIHIVSFFIVALLVSWVVEQEKKSRSLLTRKENEFDQLDLLHKGIIEHVTAGIVSIDLMGNIKSFNRAAEEISGFRFPDVKSTRLESVFPGLLGILDTIRNERPSKFSAKKHEITIVNKQGQDIILGFSVSALMNRNGNRIGDIIIFEDITLARQMEKEIERNKNLALIGEMAGGLAHEIRNPLTAMGGSIQLLKRNLNLAETDQRLMQIILRGRDQLEKLISNFLLLARPNQSQWEDIDARTLIDEIFKALRKSQDWRENIFIEKDIPEKCTLHGNPIELKQLFWNLLMNAVQAMSDGGALKIKGEYIIADDGKEWQKINISDTGSGIDALKIKKIFVPFFTTKEGGTGLGLAIVNRIVESHGGVITIESEEGKGTACIVLLPARKGKTA